MQALVERRGGGGNNDSISIALRPQLRNRHSIKTHSGSTDRKQIELTGEHTTLYQTNTQKNPHTTVRKGTAKKFHFRLFELLEYFRVGKVFWFEVKVWRMGNTLKHCFPLAAVSGVNKCSFNSSNILEHLAVCAESVGETSHTNAGQPSCTSLQCFSKLSWVLAGSR